MILLLALLGFLNTPSASANDRALDLSSGCKVYKLDGKAWKQIDSSTFEGYALSNSQILKDEKFTVFKTEAGTYGVNQKCVKAGSPDPGAPEAMPVASEQKPGARRASAAKPSALNGRSEWAAVFSMGMNLSPKGTTTNTVAGASTSSDVKFKNSIAFMGGASYRLKPNFRLSAEIGLSQLTQDTSTGNETSYFDIQPEFIFRAGTNTEIHVGPALGLYFFSQNTETNAAVTIKQQSASSVLLGLDFGADYAITSQFDLGLFVQYMKPGSIKITSTQISNSASVETTISASYSILGARFTIHF